MSSESILDKLKHGEYDKLDKTVKSHLSKLKKSRNYSELVEFTHSFVDNVSLIIKKPESLDDSLFLIDVALYCYDNSGKDRKITPLPSIKITRALYTILEFLTQQNPEGNDKIIDLLLTISNHLEQELEYWNDENVSSKRDAFCNNSCVYLYKAAKKYTKQINDVENDAKCFNLQKLALKFITKVPDGFIKLCSYATRLAIHYIKPCRTDFRFLILFYEDIFRQICVTFEASEHQQNLIGFNAVFEFVQGWLYYLQGNASAWKAVALNTVEIWNRYSLCFKNQSSLQLLWDFNLSAMKLTVFLNSLTKGVNSQKVVESAIRTCIHFLQANKNRDYDKIISKSLMLLWDSICARKNCDSLLEHMKNDFEFYCSQVGSLLIEFLNWEFFEERNNKDKTLIILISFFRLLDRHLNSLLSTGKDATIKKDLIGIENIISKFGNVFVKFELLNYTIALGKFVCEIVLAIFKNKYYTYAISVCSVSQKQMIMIIQSKESYECFEKYFWTFTRCYVESLKHTKRHKEALNFIAQILAADCKDKEQAIQLWVDTKLTVKETFNYTILDLVSKHISSEKNVEDLNSLLICEANTINECYLKLHCNVSVEMLSIANQLNFETTNKIYRAVLLITKAKLLGVDSDNLTGDLLKLCEEAIKIFGRNKCSSNSSQVSCYLAHAYFYQYIIKSRLKYNLLKEKFKTSNAEQILKLSKCTTIFLSLNAIQNLDLALNIWSTVISDLHLIPCLKSCLRDLFRMASVYSIQRMTKNEFKSLKLAHIVAKALEDHIIFGYTSCQIALIFCQYGLTADAAKCLVDAKEFIKRSNDDLANNSGKPNELKILKQYIGICESECLLIQNEVIRGWRCLQNVIVEMRDLPKSKSTLLLSIETKLLKSKFLNLPFSTLPFSERESATPLEVLSDAYCEVFSLINCSTDYRYAFISARIINNFFDCIMQLGNLYFRIGDPNMALSILKEPLNWAFKLSLSKRIVDIYMMMANINVIKGDFESCQSHLRTVKYIFQSEGEEISVTTISDSYPIDENQLEDEELVSESILNTNIDSFEDINSIKKNCSSSPVLENFEMEEHVSNCTCDHCEQFLFPIACLEFSFLQAQCFYLKDVYKNYAITILRKKRLKFEILFSRIALLILQSVCYGKVKLSDISNLKIYSSFHVLKLDIYCKLITLSLNESEINEAYLLSKEAGEEIKKLFWMGFQDLNIAIAHSQYLYCLTKILKHAKLKNVPVNDIFNKMWSYATRLSAADIDFELEFDFLESKIEQICLNDNEGTDYFKTPKQNLKFGKSRRLEKCKAPTKYKLLSVRPNQFNDFIEDEPIMKDQYFCNSSEEKENEDSFNFSKIDCKNLNSTINVRRRLLQSCTATKSCDVLQENNVNKVTVKANKVYEDGHLSQSNHQNLITKHFVYFLEAIIDKIAHFPVYPLYGDLHLLLALCKGNRQIDSGVHLLETFGLTLRHQSLLASTLRIRNSKDTNGPIINTYDKSCQDICNFKHFDKDSKKFINYNERLNDLTSFLDKDIIVCQINTLPKAFYDHSKQLNSELVITRLQKGRQPLIIKVVNDDSRVIKGFLSNFQNLLNQHDHNSKLVDKVAWNNFRVEANNNIKLALTNIEDYWLDHWKGLLLGTPAIEDDRKALRKIVEKINFEFSKSGFSNVNLYILETIVDSLPWLSRRQLQQALANLLNFGNADDLLVKLSRTVRQYAKPLLSQTFSRLPLVLVLDKTISSLPWESIPILANNAVTRMPSIYSVLVHASLNQYPKPIDSSKGFYVVDPESNLLKTSQHFEAVLKPLNWSGICQRRPSKIEWETAIKDNELFVYCGHGNGKRYYNGKSIGKQMCKATLILSGCSSVKLEAINYFEANGDVLQYIMAGSPCVVGTLWNVTDVEIDAVVTALLEKFLPSSEVRKTMCEALISARTACKLRYLTGATTVIYGMPIIAK